MAVAIYHGAAGSYKSASAVWFQILPALREGRCVVTNIKGMKTVEDIEKALGERFPTSTKIIRILANNDNGIRLWQHFYCWAPLGALIVIDEAQDIYNKTAGFDATKNTYKPISDFAELLPAGYLNYYERIFNSFKSDERYVDDTGFSSVDVNGRPVLPRNYNESLMQHRHYNWDIYYLTPEIKQIDASVRGVCEMAFHHSSKDNTFLTKRRPRIWEHCPKSASTKPTKDSAMTYRRIPLAVHLMYSSTSTGKITKAGLGKGLLSMWKFWLFLIVMAACLATLIYTISNYKGLGNEPTIDDSTSVVEVVPVSAVTQIDSSPDEDYKTISDAVANGIKVPRVASGYLSSSVSVSESIAKVADFLNAKLLGLSGDFNDVYLSSVTAIKRDNVTTYRYLLNSKDRYLNSELLTAMGFEFRYLNECLAYVGHSGRGRFIECDHMAKSWKPEFEDGPALEIEQPELVPFGELASNI
ncbi:hypothetical protein L4D76_19165 [Photobacterium sagamiensis]|uniref:zonular occludens toxin domain-containing protein n=1 Tax=Photobacterium sagamiensis TaxID=2910241 RepID=UPI003D0DCC17